MICLSCSWKKSSSRGVTDCTLGIWQMTWPRKSCARCSNHMATSLKLSSTPRRISPSLNWITTRMQSARRRSSMAAWERISQFEFDSHPTPQRSASRTSHSTCPMSFFTKLSKCLVRSSGLWLLSMTAAKPPAKESSSMHASPVQWPPWSIVKRSATSWPHRCARAWLRFSTISMTATDSQKSLSWGRTTSSSRPDRTVHASLKWALLNTNSARSGSRCMISTSRSTRH